MRVLFLWKQLVTAGKVDLFLKPPKLLLKNVILFFKHLSTTMLITNTGLR